MAGFVPRRFAMGDIIGLKGTRLSERARWEVIEDHGTYIHVFLIVSASGVTIPTGAEPRMLTGNFCKNTYLVKPAMSMPDTRDYLDGLQME